VGSGIASSLVHEVGHQAAALLDLVASLRPVLQAMQNGGGAAAAAWRLYERWISEIVADLWSVARVGIAAPLGLIAVVSLPKAFVFRIGLDDPHPFPWIRVKLSCAMGKALYPHPQWDRLAGLWESYYPPTGLDAERQNLLALLEATISRFVGVLIGHRPNSLRGKSLGEVLPAADLRPARLAAIYRTWRAEPRRLRSVPPTLVFAAVGQAKADGRITPEEESQLLADLLTYWAMRSTLDASEICTARPRVPARPTLTADQPPSLLLT